jgi:hypothetical protein
MNQLTEQVSAILLAVVGVAILAVLVSKNANTAGVLSAGGSAFSSILGAATAPVTGGGGYSLPNFGSGMGAQY